MSGTAAWADALQALTLFAADPLGAGGIWLRAGAGPVRDRFLALLYDMLPDAAPVRRLPLHAGDDRLLGGLDLAATLQAGRLVVQKGLLAEADGGVVVLAMAERIEPGPAARLRAALDDRMIALQREGLSSVLPAAFGVVALDEGTEPDERPPESLLDRMAFHLDLTEVTLADCGGMNIGGMIPRTSTAMPRLPVTTSRPAENARASVAASPAGGAADGEPVPLTPVDVNVGHAADAGAAPLPAGDAAAALCHAALALGIGSTRAPLLALRVARIASGLSGDGEIDAAGLALAARLVLGPRATCLPAPQDAQAAPEPPPEREDTQSDAQTVPDAPLQDVVLDAAKAALPADLLAQLAAPGGGGGLARAPGRAGPVKLSVKRGRPIGSRAGEPKNGARLHLLETLKAAAPWQSLRGRSDRLQVRRDDFRIVRFRQRIGTTTVFTVDASGSAAMHRLAEAKGAVELLLADCYVRRDQVALIAFRGNGATLLLPPTGSLLRARRSLAGLPGGGATPLAAGIAAAGTLADSIRRAGRTPVITLLTDARANIARDGTGGRPRAEAEALQEAGLLRATRVATLLVDTSPRPNPFARRLADEMGGRYVALPYADASALSRAVRSAAMS